MSQNIPNVVAAMCSITETASGSITFASNAGFSASGSSHGSTGVYALVLDQALDATQRIVLATVVDGTPADATITVTNTDDSTVTVQVRVAGTLSDAVSFNVAVLAMPNGVG